MKTKDIKKGTKVQLRNGFKAVTMECARKSTTCCEVDGYVKECGSVYTSDIVGYWDAENNYHTDIEYSDSQIKTKKYVNSMKW